VIIGIAARGCPPTALPFKTEDFFSDNTVTKVTVGDALAGLPITIPFPK
jgi:hypothetical protein